MARGWESKSVESQIADRQSEIEAGNRHVPRAVEERERKRASLSMSRRRVLTDLETATTPAHRAALENALAFLDDELTKLDR
ncbi:MAG TPA: hypothetical protein VMS56_07915 [Thermoanaerobaculia bacterium]|nr:hypothetical protein [Thermoanaerobaculia bacterium]